MSSPTDPTLNVRVYAHLLRQSPVGLPPAGLGATLRNGPAHSDVGNMHGLTGCKANRSGALSRKQCRSMAAENSAPSCALRKLRTRRELCARRKQRSGDGDAIRIYLRYKVYDQTRTGHRSRLGYIRANRRPPPSGDTRNAVEATPCCMRPGWKSFSEVVIRYLGRMDIQPSPLWQ